MITKIHKIYKEYALLIKFLGYGAGLLFLWYIFYHYLRYLPFVHMTYEYLTAKLTLFYLHASKFALNILGYEVSVDDKLIIFENTSGIYLDRGCLARNLKGLFAGFIIAFPGNINNKLWYIPAGLGVIAILNIIRICALAYTATFHPDYMDFNHHFAFKYTVYFFTFLLWAIWIKYLRKPSDIKTK